MYCLIYEDIIIVYPSARNVFLSITLVCTLIELDREACRHCEVNDPMIYKRRHIYWQIDFSNCSASQWEQSVHWFVMTKFVYWLVMLFKARTWCSPRRERRSRFWNPQPSMDKMGRPHKLGLLRGFAQGKTQLPSGGGNDGPKGVMAYIWYRCQN